MNNQQTINETFQENVDSWIKHINAEFNKIKGLESSVIENTNNTEYNYSLITELREEIDILKKELTTMRLLQLLK